MQAVRPLERPLTRYSLEITDPDRHRISVECHVAEPAADQTFRFASWIPGSYLLREFARHVISVEAVAGDRQVAVEKIDKSTWRVAGTHATLSLRFVVFAHDLSVRGAFVDRRRAFFNGTSVFPWPVGRETEAVTLNLAAPTHGSANNWRVATAMRPVSVDERGFGTYEAADFDELIDHPFEISAWERADFTAAGVPHALVVAGAFDSDLERVATDLTQLCESQIDFFGRPAPFDSYTFLGLAVGTGYGGLEHRASSSLIFDRNDLPRVGEPGVPRSYQRFLGLCSHEYFHSWHIKRSKPEAFIPYRLDRRNHTRLLWVFEGITTYYQERFLLMSGLIDAGAYLRRLSDSLSRVYRVPGRLRQSLAESSFDAWDSLYKPGPSSANTGVSYYSKGGLVAFALDLELRRASGGRVSLDDVVVALWERFGKPGIGLPEDGFEALVEEISGQPLGEFFDRAIRGTADIELAPLIESFGITFGLRPAAATDAAPPAPLSLAASITARDNGVLLDIVFDGGSAAGAGLAPGDIVIAIDGYVVAEKDLAARLARYAAGDRVPVDYIRDGLLLRTEMQLQPAPADTCELSIDSDAPEDVQVLRDAWLCS